MHNRPEGAVADCAFRPIAITEDAPCPKIAEVTPAARVGRLAALVVDRRCARARGLGEVDARDEVGARCRQQHRPGVRLLFRARLGGLVRRGLGEVSAGPIHSPTPEAAAARPRIAELTRDRRAPARR